MDQVTQIDVIASNERGLTENSWLRSYHSYSFGRYHNLKRLNFGTLRVFNEDTIAAGKGFGMHPHENMEIITIVLNGAIEHKDSMGNHGVIKAGQVQRMTAGTGVHHSEINPLKTQETHLFQIWIFPETRNLEPSYEQKTLDMKGSKNVFQPIVSNRKIPFEKTLFIHQDATLYLGEFDRNKTITHKLRSKKHGDYLFVIEGEIGIGDHILKTGDSAQVSELDELEMKIKQPSKLLLIEVGLHPLN